MNHTGRKICSEGCKENKVQVTDLDDVIYQGVHTHAHRHLKYIHVHMYVTMYRCIRNNIFYK